MGLDAKRCSTFFDEVIRWSVFAVVFAAPFSKSISEIAITLAIISLVLKKIILRETKLNISYPQVALIIFAISAIPSLFFSAYPDLSYKAFFTKHLKYVFFYFAIIDVFSRKDRLKDFFIIAFTSAVIIAIDGFVQYYYATCDGLHFPGYPLFKYRMAADTSFFRGFPTACFPYPNDLAAWIILVIFPMLTIMLFGMTNILMRLSIGLTTASLFYLIFLTKTRGAWVAAAIGFIFIAISKRTWWIIALLIITLATPFILKMEMAQYIFGTASLGDRFSMWGTSWDIFKQNPIIGNGINTFFRHYMNMRTDEFQYLKGSYAHNCYLQMASDIGLIGLCAFFAMIAAHAVSVKNALKKMADPFFSAALFGVAVALGAFLIHSTSDTNLYSLNLVTLFWTFLGISQAIVRATSNESKPE